MDLVTAFPLPPSYWHEMPVGEIEQMGPPDAGWLDGPDVQVFGRVHNPASPMAESTSEAIGRIDTELAAAVQAYFEILETTMSESASTGDLEGKTGRLAGSITEIHRSIQVLRSRQVAFSSVCPDHMRRLLSSSRWPWHHTPCSNV